MGEDADGTATERVAATVWPWRRDTPAARRGDQARLARSARRRAILRTLVGFAVAATLAFWKPWLAVVVVTLSLLTLALALVSPLGGHARLEHALGRLGHGIGLAVTWLVMPPLYYLLFLPTGLVLRARRRLRLTRRPDAAEATYWTPPRRPAGMPDAGRWQGTGLDRYRRQF